MHIVGCMTIVWVGVVVGFFKSFAKWGGNQDIIGCGYFTRTAAKPVNAATNPVIRETSE